MFELQVKQLHVSANQSSPG